MISPPPGPTRDTVGSAPGHDECETTDTDGTFMKRILVTIAALGYVVFASACSQGETSTPATSASASAAASASGAPSTTVPTTTAVPTSVPATPTAGSAMDTRAPSVPGQTGPGAADAQLRYLCSTGEAASDVCGAAGFEVPSPPTAASAADAQLQYLCSRGEAGTGLCADAGFAVPHQSDTPSAADAQLQYLCSQGDIDTQLCRESGF